MFFYIDGLVITNYNCDVGLVLTNFKTGVYKSNFIVYHKRNWGSRTPAIHCRKQVNILVRQLIWSVIKCETHVSFLAYVRIPVIWWELAVVPKSTAVFCAIRPSCGHSTQWKHDFFEQGCSACRIQPCSEETCSCLHECTYEGQRDNRVGSTLLD